MNHASLVPLIGGETIAQQNAFGTRPDFLASFSPFKANEEHLNNYYSHEVPYHLLDEGSSPAVKATVINSVCPCAGLSSLSVSASSDSKVNDWMFTSAEWALSEQSPEVYWGENAPRLASKMGEPVVERLRKIGKDNGYVFSIYKTKSILHGLPQVRDRAFYFFWKGDRIPVLPYFDKPRPTVEDFISDVEYREDDPMSQLCNEDIPSQGPFYRFVLEEIAGGVTHTEYAKTLTRTANVMSLIESAGIKYADVATWMRDRQFHRIADRCERIHTKIEAGGNIMRKNTEIPRDYIGAFVGHMPTMLTHPTEDRYLTIRESLSIMKLPEDFQLLNPKRTLNHICQNVPVTTAQDMAEAIKDRLDGRLTEDVRADYAIQCNKSQKFWKEPLSVSSEVFA